MNKVVLTGRIGNDIEVKKTANGTSCVEISLAVNEKYKGEETTTWVKCKAYSGIADYIGYFHKGDKILAEGRYKIDEYTDKEGNKKYSHYILLAGVEPMIRKEQKEEKPEEPKEPKADTITAPDEERFDQFGWF